MSKADLAWCLKKSILVLFDRVIFVGERIKEMSIKAQVLRSKMTAALVTTTLLGNTLAFADCGEKYVAHLEDVKPKLEEQKKKKEFRENVGIGTGAAAAVAVAPGAWAATMGPHAIPISLTFFLFVAFGAGSVAGGSIVTTTRGTDNADELESNMNATQAGIEVLRQAHIGEGDLIRSITSDVINQSSRRDVTIALVAQTVVQLDQENSFCAKPDELDSARQMEAKVIERLK